MNEEQLKQYVKDAVSTLLEGSYYNDYVAKDITSIFALAHGMSSLCDTILKSNGVFTIEKSFKIYEYITDILLADYNICSKLLDKANDNKRGH